jgi:hypothetical protein
MKTPLWTGLLGFALAGAASANDYPTQARVEFVIECMKLHGGQDYANMYKCSCSIDRVASVIPYEEFVEADTYLRGRSAMGERGSIFRDPPRGRALREKLQQAEEQAERQCFVGGAGTSKR